MARVSAPREFSLTGALFHPATRHSQPVTSNTTEPLSTPPTPPAGICLAILFLSIMALAQSCRLGVHIGYMVRVVASDPPAHKALASHLAPIMQRSSLYFAVGLRLLFVFPPYLLYLIGEWCWGSRTTSCDARLQMLAMIEQHIEPCLAGPALTWLAWWPSAVCYALYLLQSLGRTATNPTQVPPRCSSPQSWTWRRSSALMWWRSRLWSQRQKSTRASAMARL